MLNDPDGRNPGDPQKHITAKGDNLSKIGKKYGVSVDNLAKWNNLKDKNKIGINQSLIVSDPTKQVAKENFEKYPDFGIFHFVDLNLIHHKLYIEY